MSKIKLNAKKSGSKKFRGFIFDRGSQASPDLWIGMTIDGKRFAYLSSSRVHDALHACLNTVSESDAFDYLKKGKSFEVWTQMPEPIDVEQTIDGKTITKLRYDVSEYDAVDFHFVIEE